MIIFAHSKCKRYENRKIQGVALPKKERNGQEWKSSHHGTHHGEQDYGAVLLQVVLHSIALESSCQPIGGQEQGSRGNQQGHRAVFMEIFLLKNEGNILPLKKEGKIALIGPLADTRNNIAGTPYGSSAGNKQPVLQRTAERKKKWFS